MEKLKKQLARECKTNPKKAVVLGLLALVAVYFWAPMVWKLVGGKSRKPAAGAATALALVDGIDSTSTTPVPAAEAPAPAAAAAGIGWDQLLDWIRRDPLTASRPKLASGHDPFQKPVAPIADVDPEANLVQQEEAPPDLSPQGLGLTLTSTIVGTQRSVAMIGGRAYAVGQRVIAQRGEERIAFQLTDVLADRVVLTRDEQQYILKMQRTDDIALATDSVLP